MGNNSLESYNLCERYWTCFVLEAPFVGGKHAMKVFIRKRFVPDTFRRTMEACPPERCFCCMF